MTRCPSAIARAVLDAAEDFRQAHGKDELWARLHRHLAGFAISGLQYGTEATGQGRYEQAQIFDSLCPGYLETKLREGLLEHDEFLRESLHAGKPVLWSDSTPLAARLADFSADARRSLDIDWSFGVTTGVTLSMHFAGGLGISAMGCHAADLSWAEFDRLWREHGDTVAAIANAFDITLRHHHGPELFPLTVSERECLLWLAAGMPRKQIADHLRLTDRQVEKRFATARGKLKATTTTQAMATALVFGLIAP